MKLFCHIGMPHTDADRIQAHLAANADWLVDRGIGYGALMARSPAHDTLWVACAQSLPWLSASYGVSNAEDQAELRRRIGQSIAWEKSQWPGHVDRMVLSCADLFGAMRDMQSVRNLHTVLDPHFDAIELIVYLRRQDDALLADYADRVLSGTTSQTFADHAEACIQPSSLITPYLYYKRELEKWIAVWGKGALTLRRYTPTDMIANDPVQDVLGVLMDTWEPDTEGFHILPPKHALPSAPALSYLKELNQALSEEAGAPGHVLRHALQVHWPTTPRPIMPAPLSLRIMGAFGASNQWVKEQFAPDLEQPLFPPRPDHPEFGNLDTLTAEDAVRMSALLLAGARDPAP